MLRRRLPSSNSLFTFEVAARLSSFSDAARELNVTQPAISRSISRLEEHLGYPLFIRHGRWIELTHNGNRLFRSTTSAFGAISDTLREIDYHQEDHDSVTVSMSSTVVNYWFIPHLSEFTAHFPNVDLNFEMFASDNDDIHQNADLSIRLSNPKDADMHRWPFADERILALCSPDYLAENGTLDKPVEGRPHSLIEGVHQRYSLDEFFHATGQQSPVNANMIKFSDYSSTMQAAILGQGITLAWIAEASKQVIDGNLVPACTQVVKTGRRYHILASNLTPLRPIVEEVRDWLANVMRGDQRKLTSILKSGWDLF